MTGLEPVADAVTGTLAAGAAEPQTGLDPTGHTTEKSCLNCGAALVGSYCHECGQKGHVHRSLSAFAHDLAHGVLHFEGKIWRTLPLLLWRPGTLTRRYIDGQRATFVSPIALFLFSVFLMFAVVSWMTPPLQIDGAGLRSQLEQGIRTDELKLKTLEAALSSAKAEGNAVAAERLERSVRSQREDIAASRRLADDGLVVSGTTVSTPFASLDKAYREAKKNPELLLFKLKSNGYKWSWALIPLSVPWLWLVFPFSRRFRLYDHMVFVTYSLTFMTLLVIIGSLVAAAGASNAWALLLFLPPLHIYRQLRGAYALSRFGASWRTLVLVTAAMLNLVLFGLLLVMLGIS
jgi:hypothetical protein